MSGLEIVGVILGAFPLAISAMEHYEESKKVAGTFYRIRRVHRKDFGRVKDCQLKFRLNIKELILPLLIDDIVTKIEYEQLLASPGGPGWREDHVEDSLVERLGECHERYIEILQEMEETMMLLCKATKVDDEQFRTLLRSQNGPASTPAQRARDKLMTRSYAVLQARKIAYAFTIPQRESLLEEIEGLNAKLEDVLMANDRVSGLTRLSPPTKPRIPRSLLQFWRHADSMFKLLVQAWQCHCKSLHRTRLWLKHRVSSAADLKIMLQFCFDTRCCMHIQLADEPALSTVCQPPGVPLRLPLRLLVQQSTVSAISAQGTTPSIKSSGGATTVTMKRTNARVSWAPGHHQQQQQPNAAASKDLGAEELCKTMRATGTVRAGECYGALNDPSSDSSYIASAFESSPQTINVDTVTLGDIISGKIAISFTRTRRYHVAATLASTLLQLESTSWAKGWTAGDVYFTHDSVKGQGMSVELDKPFFLADLGFVVPADGDDFKALGILLLELCFGKSLDEHVLWQRPGFAMAKNDIMLRHFFACEWLKDAEGEAGERFANAVRYCLQQAPVALVDDKWRVDFARLVVWPLQQCYESMQPSKKAS